ncbi:glutathione S-transferase N-terminal domain-containing protein [Novosphingobium sp.]|uniref:glutathione S-transferase N-terminal domain-containing protein n=1 Tax=Novosphingobium sp. TaxID=1874826 RepID=UPI0025F3470D|nr:glutathione S-transferase N-terminal domain-containing protein [Novosphingobium sp.]MCC6926735.1 glutathione S-transferase N-terminal domain-containing protein [Novosphingobium sp.]
MYRLYGALGSPYSMKMRALLRYRRLTHLWIDGSAAREALGQVRAPVIPVLQYPDGHFDNDSTPLVYDLEARHPGRGVVPTDPAQAFIAHLLEDFADEWLTKAMFGYRWLEELDQIQMSRWLAFDNLKGGGLETSQKFAAMFRDRQVGRMALVGCTRENFPLIEASTRAVLAALEDHVVNRHSLFGTRPSMAEFGIYGQLSQLGTDPTPQAMMRVDYPYTYRWLAHIDDMSGTEGEWEPGFAPVVAELVRIAGQVYVPFLRANAEAADMEAATFRMEAMGLPYEQGTFKYQLKCLRELQARYGALEGAARAAVDELIGAEWRGLLA